MRFFHNPRHGGTYVETCRFFTRDRLLAQGNARRRERSFCGKWKRNQEKSKITGEQLKIEDLGGGK
jgi:hypothetical protein